MLAHTIPLELELELDVVAPPLPPVELVVVPVLDPLLDEVEPAPPVFKSNV